MTEYVIDPPATPSVAIPDCAARFPVRRIFCVGQNYATYAREMGKNPDRKPPFFFTRPADAVVDDNAEVSYPPEIDNFNYEAELQDMLRDVPEQVVIVSRTMELKKVDLIYSGTPAGIGPLLPGDLCVIEIDDPAKLATTITARK